MPEAGGQKRLRPPSCKEIQAAAQQLLEARQFEAHGLKRWPELWPAPQAGHTTS